MKKVVIFARVSSTNGTQDYERQINDLQVLASANNWRLYLRRKYLEQKRTQNAQS